MRTYVRWSDVDLFGHVNNAAYLRYLDDARFALFDMGVDADGQPTASLLVVVKHEIDYLGQLVYRLNPIDVEVWVPRIGRTSVDIAYEVVDEQRTVYLRARTRMVQLDSASRQARPFTDDERAALLAYPGDTPHLREW
ncbi:acyl-CoA thioesterase [Actinotalea sp. M2MS4P-6]|uniref:acyl-CoA thioesterase n=1 Tax=Actinotalea sp. M2MS4P-6 TaxID=2983762 RepID=UPI0021E4FA40|nr:thioesterase family protein [Actinotalea sp. M2MS4P-6]MCV2393200.1 acyl-CoA thioesterase [Actinotalea sp. M2MS4P-6]